MVTLAAVALAVRASVASRASRGRMRVPDIRSSKSDFGAKISACPGQVATGAATGTCVNQWLQSRRRFRQNGPALAKRCDRKARGVADDRIPASLQEPK